jgi:hypothetical protein
MSGEDVCAVVRDLASRQGGEVAMSGELVASQHVVLLKGQKCSGTGKNWSVCVQWASQQGSPKVDFLTNTGPLEAVATAARLLRDSDSGFTSSATIVGRLFVAPPGRGFCHANQYELLLVAKDLVEYRTETLRVSGRTETPK